VEDAQHTECFRSTFYQLLRVCNVSTNRDYIISQKEPIYYSKIQQLRTCPQTVLHYVKFPGAL
jgi:hypothetical protein